MPPGHLFCSECLHSALHIDNMKKTCPVCRTKVDPKEKKGKNQKSYYHLELKIMTANKKGNVAIVNTAMYTINNSDLPNSI